MIRNVSSLTVEQTGPYESKSHVNIMASKSLVMQDDAWYSYSML